MLSDEREGPHHPVACRRCATVVLVKKNSLAHAVVQWTGPTSVCAALTEGHTDSRPVTATCLDLRDSIEAAVSAGTVTVPDLPDVVQRSGGSR